MAGIVYHELNARVRRQVLDRYHLVHRAAPGKIEPKTCNPTRTHTHTQNNTHPVPASTYTHACRTTPRTNSHHTSIPSQIHTRAQTQLTIHPNKTGNVTWISEISKISGMANVSWQPPWRLLRQLDCRSNLPGGCYDNWIIVATSLEVATTLLNFDLLQNFGNPGRLAT